MSNPRPSIDNLPSNAPPLRLCIIRVKSVKEDFGFYLSTDADCILQVVDRVTASSAAEQGGLKKHDLVLKVNGTKVVGMTHAGIVKLIKEAYEGKNKKHPKVVKLLVASPSVVNWYRDYGFDLLQGHLASTRLSVEIEKNMLKRQQDPLKEYPEDGEHEALEINEDQLVRQSHDESDDEQDLEDGTEEQPKSKQITNKEMERIIQNDPEVINMDRVITKTPSQTAETVNHPKIIEESNRNEETEKDESSQLDNGNVKHEQVEIVQDIRKDDNREICIKPRKSDELTENEKKDEEEIDGKKEQEIQDIVITKTESSSTKTTMVRENVVVNHPEIDLPFNRLEVQEKRMFRNEKNEQIEGSNPIRHLASECSYPTGNNSYVRPLTQTSVDHTMLPQMDRYKLCDTPEEARKIISNYKMNKTKSIDQAVKKSFGDKILIFKNLQ
ncbi:hypothetical protein SNEBB_007036 [Seison nebaliae]|nr:hypothetical protein SNEBB_007036 [Seison nebaliae]